MLKSNLIDRNSHRTLSLEKTLAILNSDAYATSYTQSDNSKAIANTMFSYALFAHCNALILGNTPELRRNIRSIEQFSGLLCATAVNRRWYESRGTNGTIVDIELHNGIFTFSWKKSPSDHDARTFDIPEIWLKDNKLAIESIEVLKRKNLSERSAYISENSFTRNIKQVGGNIEDFEFPKTGANFSTKTFIAICRSLKPEDLGRNNFAFNAIKSLMSFAELNHEKIFAETIEKAFISPLEMQLATATNISNSPHQHIKTFRLLLTACNGENYGIAIR